MVEQGDRVGPFIIPPRGKRSYKEVWAEEDGQISVDGHHQAERLPPNQARGSLEDMDDETAETDQISNGPMMNRLLSCMRFEHRASPNEDKDKPNGLTNGVNGDVSMNGTDEAANEEKTVPPATAIPESALPASARNPSNAPKLSGTEMDERLKQELRFIGFIGQDPEPDYEATTTTKLPSVCACSRPRSKKSALSTAPVKRESKCWPKTKWLTKNTAPSSTT